MPAIRFVLRCGPPNGHQGLLPGVEPRSAGLSADIRRLVGAADLRAVAVLAEQCRAVDPTLAGRFAPAGLQAELTSREGRAVHAWLAWLAGEGGAIADHCPVGMISLVETGLGPRLRSSIAWLLVHPSTRRQGVATALVRRAVADVGARGGSEISAETLSSWPAATAFWRRLTGASDPATPCQRGGDGSHV